MWGWSSFLRGNCSSCDFKSYVSLLIHVLAKAIFFHYEIGTCIYSRNNTQKSSWRLYYCSSGMAKPLRIHCLFELDFF